MQHLKSSATSSFRSMMISLQHLLTFFPTSWTGTEDSAQIVYIDLRSYLRPLAASLPVFQYVAVIVMYH